MASPLDIILGTAKRIASEGKKAVLNTNVARGAQFIAKQTKDAVRGTSAFTDDTKLGIARNTVLGLPKAAKEVLAPNRGFSDEQLKNAIPSFKDTVQAVPRLGAEFVSGISSLVDKIPGVQKLANKAINTKFGDTLARGGQAIQDFAVPKTAGQAKAMRIGDVLGLIPGVGSVKNLAVAAKAISKTQDVAVIAKELKTLGVADNAIPALSKELSLLDNEVKIASKLTQSLKSAPTQKSFAQTLVSRTDPEKEIASANKLKDRIDSAKTFGRTLEQDRKLVAQANLKKEILNEELKDIIAKPATKDTQIKIANIKSEISSIDNVILKKPVTEATLDRDIAQTKTNAPELKAPVSREINDVDRMIAAGNVRVKQIDGMEKYQYKAKDGSWVTSRTDEDAAMRAKAIVDAKAKALLPRAPRVVQPAKPITLPVQLENRLMENQIAQETIKENPLNSLLKFTNKRTGELPKVTGQSNSKFARKGDDIVNETFSGLKDSEQVREEITVFTARKKEIADDAKRIDDEIKEIKKVEKAKDTNLRRLQAEQDAMIASRERATKMPKNKEVQTLEEMAKEKLGESFEQFSDKYASSLISIKTPSTPVQRKIAFWDYVRTPIEVLKKIGLEKQGRLLIQKQDDYFAELPKNIDKIVDWMKKVPSKAANVRIFQFLDGKDVVLQGDELKVANEIKVWLEEWAERLKLPKDNRIASYITHLFEDQLIAKEFDEDLAKVISDKLPGEVYNPFLEQRLGAKGYLQDTWKALEVYVKRGTRKVHMDEALQAIQDVAGSSKEFSLLEESQWEYINSFIRNVNMRPTKLETLVDNAFKQVFGGRFGSRPVIKWLGVARQMVARGAFGLNLGTAMRNLSQGVNTYAKLGEKYTALGYIKLFSRKNMQEVVDSGILEVGFIQDRMLSAKMRTLQTVDKGLFTFLDMAERVNRGAAYLGAKSKGIAMGKSEADAIRYAKDIVAKTQFRFSPVDNPVALNSPIIKTLTQFQSYTVKQTEFLVEMVRDKEFAGLLRYGLAGLTFVYTVGQLFGMKPKELIPMYRFEAPPVTKGAWELVKALMDTPDKFGNDRDIAQKSEDIGKSLSLFIPAFVQGKKTIQGIEAITKGGSYTDDGKIQFKAGETTTNKIQTILFGKYATKESKEYFRRVEKSQNAKAEMEPVYDYVQELKAAGNNEEALQVFKDLSEEEQTIYKKVKSERERAVKMEKQKVLLPTYTEIRDLKSKGQKEKALDLYKSLTPEEQKTYQDIKKSHENLEKTNKTTKTVSKSDNERNLIEFVMDYGLAFGVDPSLAWKAMTTNEELGNVNFNSVTLKRFYGRKFNAENGSEAYVKELMEKMGIPFEERDQYNLEHLVPVAAGGTNDPENLRLIPKEVHKSFLQFDVNVSKAVSEGTISRKQAIDISLRYKSGKITKEQAMTELQK